MALYSYLLLYGIQFLYGTPLILISARSSEGISNMCLKIIDTLSQGTLIKENLSSVLFQAFRVKGM